jgi:hypothetical protein
VSTAPSAPFSAWAKTVRRLAQHHATPSEPVAVESSTAPTEARRSRWPWVIGLGTAAASLCVALIAVGVIIGRGYEDQAPYAFTGTVKEVIFDLKPVHLEAEKVLREHASVQAVGHGAAG